LIVTDSGRGFDQNQVAVGDGLGLISVRERVRMIGGEIEIDSAPSRGAKIQVCVPTQKRFRQAMAA
jgi:signal transduction histidine kinase